ncbi:MAG: DNA alkylation repair protein [Bacteroidia bacterium]|nr:DNA alkylation repair protein [Bacteroidia bacterium]MBT8268706.1 DNA alkylation repair protein [Bacteroidia bacterium]NNF82368.1 DNA alkylation repair protein [Flavobacteriaceae bacterium]NNK69372.1 DNA alkylation repair protein [Flavobacteriaceae bacterium]NNL79172.1 DNA alkylation repair protein [Flavobacteriaceae bacterium]
MFIDELTRSFKTHANPEHAFHMKAYMKNHFEFFGIKAALRRQLFAAAIANNKEEIHANCRDLVKKMYGIPFREIHLCAMELFHRIHKKSFAEEDIELIEFLITNNSWWDTVDFIAKYLLGLYLKQFPDNKESVIEKFSGSDDMWLNRSTLLFQLGYKSETDSGILFELSRKFSDSNEFFIKKAIGWALREYAKTKPEAVLDFVNSTQLKPLSKREAIRNI